MDTRIEDYLTNADRFSAVVAGAHDWDAQSPCEDWTAADVLSHVVDTQRDFLDKRGADLDELAATDPAARWDTHVEQVRGVVADEAFVTEEYDGYFGRTTIADTMANFYGFDMLVHRWDLARGAGADVEFTDAELDRIEQAVAGFGDHLYADGICEPPVEVSADASRRERVLATMGRRA